MLSYPKWNNICLSNFFCHILRFYHDLPFLAICFTFFTFFTSAWLSYYVFCLILRLCPILRCTFCFTFFDQFYAFCHVLRFRSHFTFFAMFCVFVAWFTLLSYFTFLSCFSFFCLFSSFVVLFHVFVVLLSRFW